uniref:phytol kinase n=1 Tax=Quercus lobata TaxID=97700 RepID=A0A7N2LH15_QUELO
MYFYRQVNRNQAETKHFMLLLRVYAYSLFVITLPSLSQIFISLLIGAEFKQKTGSYIVWAVFHGFLANFQNSTTTEARYFACLVPLVNFLRLVIHGLSLASDEGLIKSVTREGKPEELLRGPLYYVLILILCALIFWRESPVGLISLAMMCGGDGIADIIGRRFGSLKIPYNQQKSWAGSISMFIFGFLISIGMLQYYSVLGYLHLDWVQTVQKVALVSLVATVVESLPTTEVVDDNISVPLVSMAVAFSMFGY